MSAFLFFFNGGSCPNVGPIYPSFVKPKRHPRAESPRPSMGVLSHKNVCGGAIHFVQLLRGPCSRKTENGMNTRSPRPLNLTCRGIPLSSFPPPPTRCHTPWQIPCQSGRIILCNSMVPSPCLSAFPGRPLAFKLDSKHRKQQTHHHNWQLIVILLPHTDPSLSPLHDFGLPRWCVPMWCIIVATPKVHCIR
jgi:hypothetical protein